MKSYLHLWALGAATLHLNVCLACDLTTFCRSFPLQYFSCPVRRISQSMNWMFVAERQKTVSTKSLVEFPATTGSFHLTLWSL